jgi:hypothetical protein
MPLSRQILLLFTLNFLDAVFTLYWVRNGFASEGNHLMASLLDMGDIPFLAVKIAVGAVTAMVLWNWRDKKLAKYGLGLVLTIYVGLMGIHFFTGLTASGLISETMVNNFSVWSNTIFAFMV